MARLPGARLKVFVVPTGFHDAYVAAPSRKAALAAWGSEHDLFARGIAQEVTDPALTAEPLSRPGEVIKRSRGTAEQQIAALPPNVARADVEETESEAEGPRRKGKTASKDAASKGQAVKSAPTKPVKIVPRPSREELERAEGALAEAEDRHRRAEADLAERQAALDRERRETRRAQDAEREELSDAVDAERVRYDRAIARWRE